jgi:hypothetical protein
VNREVGNCWQASTTNRDQLHGENQRSVACDASATAYTYAMGIIAGAPAKRYLSKGFLNAATMSELPERILRQVTDECEAGLGTFFGKMTVLQIRQLRVATAVTLPTRNQWTDGARWFSCEVSLREVGSSLATPVWQELPSPISKFGAEMAAHPKEYRLCVDTARNSILPTGTQGVVADCATARWALQPVSLGLTYGEIYPGDAKAKTLATQRCQAANSGALAVVTPSISARDWQAPEASVGCWVSVMPDPVATPTSTPEPVTPSPAPSTRRVVPVPVEPEVPIDPEVPVDPVPVDPVVPTTEPTTPVDPPV